MVSTWSDSCGPSRTEGACQAKEGGDPIVRKRVMGKMLDFCHLCHTPSHVVSSVLSSIP